MDKAKWANYSFDVILRITYLTISHYNLSYRLWYTYCVYVRWPLL